MSVKQRLIEFIKYNNLGQGAFEKKVGLSNGYVNNIRNSIQPDKLHKIALQFPDLNKGWLMTGEGEMIDTRIIGRFYRYLEYKGIGIEDTNKILGWSKTLDLKKMKFVTTLQDVKNDDKRDLDWERSIKRILKKFPDINEEWLRTGAGDMLIAGEIMPSVQNATFLARISGSDLLPKYKAGDIVVCQIVGTAQIEKPTKSKSKPQTKKQHQ